MAVIKVYLCNKKLPGIEVVSNSAKKAITVEGNLVRAKMQPVGYDPTRVVVRAKMMPETAMASMPAFFACLERLIGKGTLIWRRVVQFADNGDFQERDRFITIDINHPDDPCHWARTELFGRRDEHTQQLFIAVPSRAGGMIPASKADVYVHDLDVVIKNSQTRFVPGELLQLRWELTIDERLFSSVVAGKYFATPAITGGVITGVTGTGIGTVYAVQCQGYRALSVPTDFADYQVGDWVYLLKQAGDSAAGTTDRDDDYDDEDAAWEFTIAIDRGIDTSGDPEEDWLPIDADWRVVFTGETSGYITTSALGAPLYPVPIHTFDNLVDPMTVVHLETDPEDLAGKKFFSIPGGFFLEGWGEGKVFRFSTSAPEPEGAIPGADYDKSDLVLRMLPATVNDVGPAAAASGGMEALDYDMLSAPAFERFFEVSKHIGVITELWPGNVTPLRDAAKITIEDFAEQGEFDWVDIFYHCPESATVAGGMAAFAVGDEVIVLNEGGGASPSADDLVIVGLKDGLKLCATGFLKISRGGIYGHVTFFDFTTNTTAALPVKNNAGELVTFPAKYSDISNWMAANVLEDVNDAVLASKGMGIGFSAMGMIPTGRNGWCVGTNGLTCSFDGETDTCSDSNEYDSDLMAGGALAVSHQGENIELKYGGSYQYHELSCAASLMPGAQPPQTTEFIGTASAFIAAVNDGKVNDYINFGSCSASVQSSFGNRAVIGNLSANRRMESTQASWITNSLMNSVTYQSADFSYSVYSPFEIAPVHQSDFGPIVNTGILKHTLKWIGVGARKSFDNAVGFFTLDYKVDNGVSEERPASLPLIHCYSKSDLAGGTVNPFTGLSRNAALEATVKDLADLAGTSSALEFEFIKIKTGGGQ